MCFWYNSLFFGQLVVQDPTVGHMNIFSESKSGYGNYAGMNSVKK